MDKKLSEDASCLKQNCFCVTFFIFLCLKQFVGNLFRFVIVLRGKQILTLAGNTNINIILQI